MKKPPDNPEFVRFTEAMRHIMGVSKTEIKEREAAEKINKKGKRIKTSSASLVPAFSSKNHFSEN
jgi:hypothetical protein